MLFVVFQLGSDRYAIDGRELVEVLPLVRLKSLPHAPAGVAGLLDYRGAPVPVIDLCAMALGRPAAQLLSTRTLLVRCADGHLLGLIAERVNEMLKREPADFVASGVTVDGAPYLGGVTRTPHGLVQWIAPEKLLSPAVRDALFHPLSEVA
jgi:chemotaxis-related protein WspB